MCFSNTVVRLAETIYIPGIGGQYDDFTGMWFRENGISIMSSSITAAAGILGAIASGYILPRLQIFWDRKLTNDSSITRKLTHKNYLLVYTAEEYDVAAEYAEFLNIIFFALTFGFSMPILFVGTFLTLIAFFYKSRILSKKKFIKN